jgi:hypothetical protein
MKEEQLYINVSMFSSCKYKSKTLGTGDNSCHTSTLPQKQESLYCNHAIYRCYAASIVTASALCEHV